MEKRALENQMKTPNRPNPSTPRDRFQLKILALAAGLIVPAATGVAQNYWQGPANGSADYNIPANWVGNAVPTGGSANPANDNGSNSVILIQAGDPTWSVNSLRVGWENNTSGSYLQTGGTVTTVLKYRIGAGNSGTANNSPTSASIGYYTLNGGIINCGSDFNVGELGTAVLNINGGTINMVNGNFGDNNYNGAGNTGVNTVTDEVNQVSGAIAITGNGQLFVGNGGPAIYNMSGGTVDVHNYIAVGRSSGTGTLNMTGGNFNQDANGNLLVGTGYQNNGTPCVGVINQSAGAIYCNGQFLCPENSPGVGTYNLSGTGSLVVNSWLVFGRGGGPGVLNISGGSILQTNSNGEFEVGETTPGTVNQTGGSVTCSGNDIWIGQGGGATGIYNMNGGSLTINSWIAIGRTGGNGTLNLTNGTVTKTGNSGNHLDIGASGTGSINQYGGLVTNAVGDVWVGEQSPGTWNFNGGTAMVQNVNIAVTGSGNGTLNLNGGLFQTSGIFSTNNFIAPSTLSLNGATVQANANNPNFISGISQASIGSSGITFDSQGYSIAIPESLTDAGGGTLSKIGSGILTLTGNNSYAGTTAVNAGTLATTTASAGGGAYSVANGATLNVQVVGGLNNEINMSSLALAATATTIGIDVNNFGNPSSAPVNVGGALTVNGTVTINVADANPQLGQFPLISYSSKTGSSYVLGTLPVGVIAHLVDNTSNKSIDLDITSVNLPRWNGNVNGNWDINLTQNWINSGTGLPTTFQQGNAVTFDDNATGTTTINLATSVSPTSVNFNNNSLPYALVGTGQISGSTGLKINGTGTVAIQNTGGNNFTGPVTISAGILSVTNLANGGSPSPIGASSASPTNLVIGDGVLSYNGTPVAVNRGFTVEGTNATVDAEDNLTLGGNVTAVANLTDGGSGFTKVGPALLDLTGSGHNEFSANYPVGVSVAAGTLMIDGSAGNQTNHTQNQLFVGDTTTTGAALILTNANLSVDSWLALGRINGGVNNTSSITLYNSALNCGNLSVGWDGGQPNNLSSQFLTLNGNSSLTNYGSVNLAEGADSTFTLTINSNSVFWVQNPFYAALANSATGTVVVANSGKIIQVNGWFDIAAGANSIASVTAENNASLSLDGDVNLADTGSGATGTLTVQDNATVQANTLWVGKSTSSVCTANLAGSGAINLNNYIVTANGTGSIGNINMAGGSLTAGTDMTIGQAGTSVVTLATNSGAVLTVHGTMYLSRGSAVASGTVNLNPGSTIVAGFVNNGWGFQNNFPSPTNNPNAFNFNGGVLRAYIGSDYFIQPYVNAVIQPGGAIIDDGGFSIGILTGFVNGSTPGNLTKQGAGILYMIGTNAYTGTTLVSTGTLAGTGIIVGPVTVASGSALAAGFHAIGTLTISNTLTFAAGSTSAMKLGTSSFDQIAGLTSVAYNGALVVTNTTGGPLTPNSTYQLFRASAPGTGNFTSVTILPAGTGTFNPATGQLTITSSGALTFNAPKNSSGNIVLSGSGGTPGANYNLLTTTNLATPFTSWTTNSIGTFDGSGNFSASVPINPAQRAQFFRIGPP